MTDNLQGAARQTLVRGVLLPAWILVLVLTALFGMGLGVPTGIQYAPFALSLIFFGLPHGAVDHLVPAWLSGRRVTPASIAGVVLLYLTLSSLYLALWFAAPVAAFALFVALTWFHWGQGDLYSSIGLLRIGYLDWLPLRVLVVFVRGGLPMLVPLLFFPEIYRQVLEGAVGLFGGVGLEVAWLFDPAFRMVAGALFLASALLYLIWSRQAADPGEHSLWWVDTAEILLLLAYFAAVPPVLAVGLYFCLWHATRHIARLMMLDQASATALEKGELLVALAVFARNAALLTVAALLLLAMLYLVVPGPTNDPLSLLGVYLVLISLLTLPHVVIVSLIDWRQGLWR